MYVEFRNVTSDRTVTVCPAGCPWTFSRSTVSVIVIRPVSGPGPTGTVPMFTYHNYVNIGPTGTVPMFT